MKKTNKPANDIVFIKLGGSVLTDKSKPYTARFGLINQLADELSAYEGSMVIAHGHGSYGHTSASLYGGKKDYTSSLGIAKVNFDIVQMNKIVLDALIKADIPAVLFRPQTFLTSHEGKLKSIYTAPLFHAFTQGLVPVVCGDVIWDDQWRSTIFSGETVLSLLVSEFIKHGYKIRSVIDVGVTDGVYDKNGTTISQITKTNREELKNVVVNATYPDVSGAMAHKIDEALIVAEHGIHTFIINGTKKGELFSALKGDKVQGTEIL